MAIRPSQEAPASRRGWTLNVYLRPELHEQLRRLKQRWRCSWGQVIERLLREAGK